MSMEGPPAAPENKEKERITHEQCLEAMKAGNFELVGDWYAQEEKVADQDPTGKGRTLLTIALGEMQQEAGFLQEARETLEAAYEDAYQQGWDGMASAIRKDLDDME